MIHTDRLTRLFLALAVLSVSSFFFRAAKKRLKARTLNDNDKV